MNRLQVINRKISLNRQALCFDGINVVKIRKTILHYRLEALKLWIKSKFKAALMFGHGRGFLSNWFVLRMFKLFNLSDA